MGRHCRFTQGIEACHCSAGWHLQVGNLSSSGCMIGVCARSHRCLERLCRAAAAGRLPVILPRCLLSDIDYGESLFLTRATGTAFVSDEATPRSCLHH